MGVDCGGHGHFRRDCPNRGARSKNPDVPKNEKPPEPAFARPLHKAESCTFLTLKHRYSRIRALLDTGSDVSLVSRKLAKKYKWTVDPVGVTAISACNGEQLVIDGVARAMLSVEGKLVPTLVCVARHHWRHSWDRLAQSARKSLGFRWPQNQDWGRGLDLVRISFWHGL